MQHFFVRRLFIILIALAVAACGFQLRGLADLSFENLYIQGNKLTISKDLNSSLKTNGVKIVSDPEKADFMLELMNESTEKRILSLSGGAGVVREFELFYRVNFRMREPSNELWGPVQTIEARRDFSYSDDQILAKSYEEAMLYDNMRQDAVREMMRRLVAQKPSKATK